MRVAYLVNQYPKVSHSFIRREILALEREGVEVLRFSVRGWDEVLVDPVDRRERERTRYLLREGAVALLAAMARCALRSPRRFASALRAAVCMGRGASRPLPVHLAYLAEACLLHEWLEQAGAQHLHVHFGTNGAAVATLVRLLGGPPFSFTVHGPDEFDRPAALKLSQKVAQAKFVAAISSYGRSQLYRWIAARDWPKVQEVRCGLDGDFLEAAETPPPAAPRLVSVGRLAEAKGQLLLVEAAAILATRNVDFEIVLAGDGSLRPQLEAAIARHALGGRVRLTGWLSGSQVRDEILAARAMVMPSFAEGLPVVIMEAMALHRPVIATYVAGIPELVVPGRTGWLIPAGAVTELADAMQQCLEASPQALAQMGREAHERVSERHRIGGSARRLRDLFQRVVA